MEIRHDRPSQKRVYLRLELDEAKHLRDEIAAVIEEREPDGATPHLLSEAEFRRDYRLVRDAA